MKADDNNQRDVRWKQRYENFGKALSVFDRIVLEIKQVRKSNHEASEVQQMALIQSFEVAFELGWKTLGDFLQEQGYGEIASPRSVIKQAFSSGYITDGETWLKALLDRNNTTHIYDEKEMQQIIGRIDKKYTPILEGLNDFFKSQE